MSRVWKVFGAFPVDIAEWMPYWKNDVTTDNDKVKVSYYRYTDLSGATELLAFAVNTSAKPVGRVKLAFPENVTSAYDTLEKEDVGFAFDLDAYSCRILFVK